MGCAIILNTLEIPRLVLPVGLPVSDWFLLLGITTLFAQMPPNPPVGWERAGIVTILIVVGFTMALAFLRPWVVVISQYRAKEAECEQERKRAEEERNRADAGEAKYVQILLSDIEERKSRDRTIELLSRAASKNNRSPFDEEG